jgi:DNA-directed RNA polymerase subunit K/omega
MEDDYDTVDESVAEEEYEDYEEDLDAELEEDEEAEEDTGIEDVEETEEAPQHQVFRMDKSDENHRIVKVVHPDKRKTSEIIQDTELTEAIGIRASQIENGAPVFTDVSGITDPISMAIKEFADRRNPLILERPLEKTDTYKLVEHWKVRQMIFPGRILLSESKRLDKELVAHLLRKK